ncbi:MAG: ABC transporter permease [Clostridium sp.]|uniref:ABC transporter permease n=1 Tax=Clostridium sp. TaxID=1506 RepID=UPI0025EFDFD5|nr:ABC transporter permease [Clostridium sp.]MCI6693400.1 ABC transporter permease [Clostridium sp.]MDY6228122.1 ABC transporter permease [Clostridium sp.]
MIKYVVRRFFEMIITLYLIGTATFFLLSAIPGKAIDKKIQKLPEQTKQIVIAKYGYDKPVMERYVLTLKNYIIKGEFGESLVHAGDTVSSIVKNKMPISSRLGIQQIVVGVSLGIILGVIAAMNRGKLIDYIILVSIMILASVPSLVLSLLLQKYLAKGPIFNLPIIGWPKGADLWFGGWKYTILPTLAGAGTYLAYYARLMKTSMLDSINQDYTLTARSKGLSEVDIVKKHVLRNSFIPIITVLPVAISGVISGSFFIERVFAIPGAGQYYIQASNDRDIPILMGLTLLYALIYLIAIFITDILYTVVDPRIRLVK